MKLYAFLAALLAASPAAQAETAEGKWVLFEDTYLESGYTAFGYKTAPVLGAGAPHAAVAGGWRVLDRLTFGLEADVLVGRAQPDVAGADELSAYQLGAFGEWRAYAFEFADLYAGLGAGWGEVGYRMAGESGEKIYEHDSLTYLEPRAAGFFHVSHRVDLGLGVGYRLARGVQLVGVTDGDLRGLTTSLVMRGSF